MGDLADVKRKNVYKLLRWLETKESVEVIEGGRHIYLIKHSSWSRPFPIPFKHNVINKHILKSLMQQLVDSGVCSEAEFREKIK